MDSGHRHRPDHLNADVSNDGMGREVSQIITVPIVTRRFLIFFIKHCLKLVSKVKIGFLDRPT